MQSISTGESIRDGSANSEDSEQLILAELRELLSQQSSEGCNLRLKNSEMQELSMAEEIWGKREIKHLRRFPKSDRQLPNR